MHHGHTRVRKDTKDKGSQDGQEHESDAWVGLALSIAALALHAVGVDNLQDTHVEVDEERDGHDCSHHATEELVVGFEATLAEVGLNHLAVAFVRGWVNAVDCFAEEGRRNSAYDGDENDAGDWDDDSRLVDLFLFDYGYEAVDGNVAHEPILVIN